VPSHSVIRITLDEYKKLNLQKPGLLTGQHLPAA
jgi:hypothetical protein